MIKMRVRRERVKGKWREKSEEEIMENRENTKREKKKLTIRVGLGLISVDARKSSGELAEESFDVEASLG